MGDLFDGYGATTVVRRGAPAWDEMFAGEGSARQSYREIHAALQRMTTQELRGRTEALESSYLAQGVTFDFAGEERPFPLDALPRVIEQAEWVTVEAGVKQRVRALQAFLADVYGEQQAVRDGVIPARLISSSTHFHREAAGIVSAKNVRIGGIRHRRHPRRSRNLARSGGQRRVPNGVSDVISNRCVMA